MGDELDQNPQPQPQPGKGQPNQDDIDKRLEDLRRTVATRHNYVSNVSPKKLANTGNRHRPPTYHARPLPKRNNVFASSPTCGAPRTGASRANSAPSWTSSPGALMKSGKSPCKHAGKHAP